MSGIFGPKPPGVLPPVNPADTQNRINNAMERQLSAGGTNADMTSSPNTVAPTGGGRLPTLTGLN